MPKETSKRGKLNNRASGSGQERILIDITNQENNRIVPTHIQKFNQELSKLDNYTKDKDVNSLYVKVLTFFEEIGRRYNLESVADDFSCLSFVIDFHDPYGKLDSLYRKYFGINYKDIEIYQSCDIFHVNKHLDKYIKESIEKDLLAIPDDYGGLDEIYFELAGKIIENLKILNKKTHFKTKKDTLMDEGTWTKLTIDAFFYSMIKFFDDNLVICWGESINKTTKGADLTLDYDTIKINTKSTKNQQGKKPEITVYWRDEHFETTVCLVEASFGPFAEPDMIKQEGDRRKLINCIRRSSETMWNYFVEKCNKYVNKEQIDQIKNIQRPLIHLYDTSICVLYYDESYFPIGRIRLHREIKIPYNTLEVNVVKEFICLILLIFKNIQDSNKLFKSVMENIGKNQMHGKRTDPISSLTSHYPSKGSSPRQSKKQRTTK